MSTQGVYNYYTNKYALKLNKKILVKENSFWIIKTLYIFPD